MEVSGRLLVAGALGVVIAAGLAGYLGATLGRAPESPDVAAQTERQSPPAMAPISSARHGSQGRKASLDADDNFTAPREKTGSLGLALPGSEKPHVDPAVEEPRTNPVGISLRDLADTDPHVRAKSVLSLAESVKPEASDALLNAVYDQDLNVSTMAANAVGDMYKRHMVEFEEIHRIAIDDSLPEKTRLTALAGISKVADPRAAEYLLERLRNGTVDERRGVASLIQYQGVDVAAPALIEALADEDRWVRYNANEQLRRIGRGRNFGEDAEAWRSWWETEISRRTEAEEEP